eukprot:NODE_14_length_51535_cov_1.125049.p36 type:complete len:171 gc:universal NODE_14_length_51535_cov_1.125049:8641-8129(-)
MKLLDLIEINYEIPSSKRRGRYFLHDLELNQTLIQGILKSMMKISLFYNEEEVLSAFEVNAQKWQTLKFLVNSFSAIKYLKFKFLIYQDCENSALYICDNDQVLVQGKLHRLMFSEELTWSTLIQFSLLCPGSYRLKCQIEDVATRKVISSCVYSIICTYPQEEHPVGKA